MRRWDAYWFGPIAAVRPYLLSRGLLFVLAADLWYLQPSRAAPIGMYGFDVSHFAWLDALQPPPTPELKFAVIMLCGLAAALGAMTGSRAMVIATLLLFTYSWAMSMQDMLQHHYFLSLALLCVACLPRIGARDIFGPPGGEGGGATPAGPRASAFGFVLLGVTIAIVYFFAAVTKMHDEWLRGLSLTALPGAEAMIGPLERLLAPLGVGRAAVWAAVGTGSVAIELFVSAGYLTAAWRDRAGPRARFWWLAAGAAPIAVHAVFLNMGLWIGWFTYYMLLLAAVFFFPERWLLGFGRIVTWPARLVEVRVAPHLGGSVRVGHVVAAAFAVGLGLVVLSQRLDIPGSLAVGLVSALGLVGVTAFQALRGTPAGALVWLFAGAVAGVAMTATVVGSNVRFFYYENRIDYTIETQGRAAALAALDRYERYAPPDLFYAHERLGDLALKLELPDRAVVHLRRAVALEPDHVETLNNLAWLLATGGGPADAADAIAFAQRAAELTERSDAEVLDTLAAAYAADGRYAAAVAAAAEAIEVARAADAIALAEEIGARLREYERAQRAVGRRRRASQRGDPAGMMPSSRRWRRAR